MDEAKPFLIPKREVWEAFKRVKANRGAAGVDGQSIEDFEANLSGNLYKLWNRMSSGSYFPPPVRRVDIPKASGGIRPLGIPTVADRIAQEVARRYLEPILEPVFHPDSFGYRPGKSAIDAMAKARERCWRYDWVLDLDISLKSYRTPTCRSIGGSLETRLRRRNNRRRVRICSESRRVRRVNSSASISTAAEAKRYPPIIPRTSATATTGRLPSGLRGTDGQPIVNLVAASTQTAL
jgi:hypothetical protein